MCWRLPLAPGMYLRTLMHQTLNLRTEVEEHKKRELIVLWTNSPGKLELLQKPREDVCTEPTAEAVRWTHSPEREKDAQQGGHGRGSVCMWQAAGRVGLKTRKRQTMWVVSLWAELLITGMEAARWGGTSLDASQGEREELGRLKKGAAPAGAPAELLASLFPSANFTSRSLLQSNAC